MMGFDDSLRIARRRRWLQSVMRYAAAGLAIGCGVGLLAGAIHLLRPVAHVSWWVGGTAAAGTLIGLAAGLYRRPSLAATALAIDATAGLKDRVHSALQFSSETKPNAYCQLLLRDATRTLQAQMVSRLFPWRWPKEGTWALSGVAAALLAVFLLPGAPPVEAKLAGPPPAVQQEAAELAEDLAAFEELAETFDSDEMRQLTQRLREMIEQLGAGPETTEEAMAQLARMTALVASASAQFDSLLLQQSLREVANGLDGLDGFERASSLLHNEKFDGARQALDDLGERIGSGQMNMPMSGGLTETRVAQLVSQTRQAGLGDLSDALSSLQRAIRIGSRGECRAALKRVGSLVGKYGRRVKIGRAIRSQLDRLGQCKRCLGGGYCSGCKGGGQCQGGNCKGIKLGLASLTFNRSNSPSQSAGTATAMNKFGRATEMDANRTLEQVSGLLGEGHSEFETEVSPDGRQQALRQYRKVYARYRKQGEAAMTEEAIPLAHRQTIKRYFELIHPDRLEPEAQLRTVLPAVESDEIEVKEEQSE